MIHVFIGTALVQRTKCTCLILIRYKVLPGFRRRKRFRSVGFGVAKPNLKIQTIDAKG
jgi:hypothetical protein